MTKFNYKKWVTDYKNGKPLFEAEYKDQKDKKDKNKKSVGANPNQKTVDKDSKEKDPKRTINLNLPGSGSGSGSGSKMAGQPTHTGCTDSTAYNYDSSATSDDGSCYGQMYINGDSCDTSIPWPTPGNVPGGQGSYNAWVSYIDGALGNNNNDPCNQMGEMLGNWAFSPFSLENERTQLQLNQYGNYDLNNPNSIQYKMMNAANCKIEHLNDLYNNTYNCS